MRKLSTFLCVITSIFFISGIARADLILFEDFEDSSGFTIGGGAAQYWGIAPLSGTDAIPSNFIQGDSQSGSIFYGSYAREYRFAPAALMTISLPDLTGYNNLHLSVALAASDGIWEPTHRDSLHIIGGTAFSPVQQVACTEAGCVPVSGAIDSFLPITYPDSLLSNVYSIGLGHQFRDFEYTLDSSLASLTFAFASTAAVEAIGIDSVRITGDPVAPVPEPATMLLLASGLVGLAGLRKKFRRS